MAPSKLPFGAPEDPSVRGKKMVVYTSSECPKCAAIKRWLRKKNADFEERNLKDLEVMTSLIMRNVFIMSAPALEFKGKVYTENQIFNGDGSVNGKLMEIVEGK